MKEQVSKLISVVSVGIAIFYAAKIGYETGVYECRKCGHAFYRRVWQFLTNRIAGNYLCAVPLYKVLGLS